MIEDVIRFYDTSEDLEKFSEHWEEDSYATRSEKIVDDIVRLTGFPPSPNMKVVSSLQGQADQSFRPDTARAGYIDVVTLRCLGSSLYDPDLYGKSRYSREMSGCG